jgi:outer membrane protein TolC
VLAARAPESVGGTGLPIYSTLYKGTLTASYDVDIWGVHRTTSDAAQASLAAQKAAAAAADLTVASSVASGYVSLLSLDNQLRVTESTLKAREEAFRLAQRQYETGYSSRLELMQSDSEMRATRAQIPGLRHQIAQQENALSLLIGANPGRIARQNDSINSPLQIPSNLPSSLLNRRPDIAQAEQQLIAADATLASARQFAAIHQSHRHGQHSGQNPARLVG